jgi:endothelin-converting enzyme/putative endopeptidase
MRLTRNPVQILFRAVVVCLFSISLTELAAPQLAFHQTQTQQGVVAHGIAVPNMDRSVKPGDDFYGYANGNWIKRTMIPSDCASVSVFTRLEDLTNQRTANLIREAVRVKVSGTSSQRKIADLYESFMNQAAIERKGFSPLLPHLAAIAAIRDKRELASVLGEGLRTDVDALNNTEWHTGNLFGLWVTPGFKDPKYYAPYLLQGGLQLPDREYYLSNSDSMRNLREKYLVHISAMLSLAGFTNTGVRAHRIFELERAIAEKHLSLAESEDVYKANNTWNQDDFGAQAPGLEWAEYFRGAGLSGQTSFVVWQPSALAGESALVASTPLDTWKDFLAFHLIGRYAHVLPRRFGDAQFEFFSKTLLGIPEQRPRWQRAVAMVNAELGDAVGQIYADRYFSPESKARVEEMVANIVAAFSRRIAALAWMDPATKAEAQAKLARLYVGVGYPETWLNYSAYEVKPDDIFGNVWRGSLFRYQHDIARLGLRVDRKQWSMTPQMVNAADLPIQDALSFPAAILQPPFFDPEAPTAANYGAIGTVIGHEISHMFDKEGSAFDSEGQLRNWWTGTDLAHFNAATATLVAQYDAYKPFSDLSVNGSQTVSENIADFAGISAAYDAYRASLRGKEAPLQDGFTGDQQFFIAFAQNWAAHQRTAALRHQVVTDFHAPAQYRADTARNVDAWYEAFDVQPEQRLYLAPPDRVRIW